MPAPDPLASLLESRQLQNKAKSYCLFVTHPCKASKAMRQGQPDGLAALLLPQHCTPFASEAGNADREHLPWYPLHFSEAAPGKILSE